MRTLVIGDIHGGLKALVQVLERAAVQPTDELIFLGDYTDGLRAASILGRRSVCVLTCFLKEV